MLVSQYNGWVFYFFTLGDSIPVYLSKSDIKKLEDSPLLSPDHLFYLQKLGKLPKKQAANQYKFEITTKKITLCSGNTFSDDFQKIQDWMDAFMFREDFIDILILYPQAAAEYCRFINNNPLLHSSIKNSSDDTILYYCEYVNDDKDFYSLISSSEYAYFYCNQVKDRKEMHPLIKKEPYYALLYYLNIAQDADMFVSFVSSEDCIGKFVKIKMRPFFPEDKQKIYPEESNSRAATKDDYVFSPDFYNLINDSRDALNYCRFVSNVPDVREKIVSDFAIFDYCYYVEINREMMLKIKDPEIALRFCFEIEDFEELHSIFAQDEELILKYCLATKNYKPAELIKTSTNARRFCLEVADLPFVREKITGCDIIEYFEAKDYEDPELVKKISAPEEIFAYLVYKEGDIAHEMMGKLQESPMKWEYYKEHKLMIDSGYRHFVLITFNNREKKYQTKKLKGVKPCPQCGSTNIAAVFEIERRYYDIDRKHEKFFDSDYNTYRYYYISCFSCNTRTQKLDMNPYKSFKNWETRIDNYSKDICPFCGSQSLRHETDAAYMTCRKCYAEISTK